MKNRTSCFKNYILGLSVFLIWGCSASEKAMLFRSELSRQESFSALTNNDGYFSLREQDKNKALVIIAMSAECPISNKMKTYIDNLQTAYKNDAVFYYIDPFATDTKNKFEDFQKDLKNQLPIILDPLSIAVDSLDLNLTTQTAVLIFENGFWRKLYLGGLHDGTTFTKNSKPQVENLKSVLDYFVQKKRQPLNLPPLDVYGCTLPSNRYKKVQFNFDRDIQPIFKNKCMNCHTTNGIAPWAMTDTSKIIEMSHTIRGVLLERRMPPFDFISNYKFQHFSFLTDSEIQKIVAWTENVHSHKYSHTKKKYFETNISDRLSFKPELTLQTGEENLKLLTKNTYKIFLIKPELDKDFVFDTIDFRSLSKSALHHVRLALVDVNKSVDLNSSEFPKGAEYLFSWNRGRQTLYSTPKGTHLRIPPNKNLLIQAHYNNFYDSLNEQLTFYFKLGSSIKSQLLEIDAITKYDFVIQPQSIVTYNLEKTLINNIYLRSVVHHSHFRAKKVKISHQCMGQDRKTLLFVPNYNANLQHHYELISPIKLNKGCKLYCDVTFDNTKFNTSNPNPNLTVKYGLSLDDEMLICAFSFTRDP